MSSKLKVGVIGAGTWGQNIIWAYSCNPFVELVAIADLNTQRADEMAKQYGIQKVYKDYHEMLGNEKLDIVSIVTPDFLHRQIVQDCAKAKVNILLEKPVATNMEDCYAISEAVKSNGVKFMVNFFMRWIPQFTEAKGAIDRGELGEIVTGFAKIDDVVTVPTKMLKWSNSSSPIFFVMIHNIDIVRWLISKEAVEVYAKSQKKYLSKQGYNTDDAVEAFVTFDDGSTILFEANWVLPRSFNGLNDHDVRIVGTEGVVYIDMTNQGVKVFTGKECGTFDHPNKSTVFANNIDGKIVGCVLQSVSHFVDCVRNNTEPMVSLEDGIQSTKIACAIFESLRKDAPVKIIK